jgi:hypothetical protein
MKKIAPHMLIITLAMLYGFFAGQYFIYPSAPTHELSWGEAVWISTPSKGPVGMFMKELFIPGNMAEGWVEISAPDSYKLWVNGKEVVENTFYSSNVSGIHDITTYLTPGKNVIAVAVRRLSYPGESKLLVRGLYKDASGRGMEFLSGSGWKSLDREDFTGGISWQSPLFDVSSWKDALIMEKPTSGETYPVSYPPQAITSPLEAKWIRHPDPFAAQAIFKKDFILPQRPDYAWVRLATGTDYDLVINGKAAASGNALEKTDVYSIGSLLRKGQNSIAVIIKNPLKTAHSLYLDGEVSGRGFTFPIQTGPDWKAYLPGNKDAKAPFEISTYQGYQLAKRAKRVAELSLPFNYKAGQFMMASGLTGLVLIALYAFVLLLSRAFSAAFRESREKFFRLVSFTFIFPLMVLFALFVLQFDIRVARTELFGPRVVCGVPFLLLCLQFLLLAGISLFKKATKKEFPSETRDYTVLKNRLALIAVIALVIIGACIRLGDLGHISLNGDEIGTVRFAQGILHKGYPYVTLGGINKPATTYELLPYPVALSITLFGPDDWAVRLPSALFGIANIAIIFILSRRLAGTGAGLLASAIYTFMPLEINLARNARYMVSEQFYAMMCCYSYYRAMEKEEIKARFVYLTGIFFLLCYFTWEGSGYLLPSLLTATFALKGRDFGWIKSWHLWLASVIVSIVVLIQLAYRTYWSVPFLIIGSGLSDATFKLMFLNQSYNPWYYLNEFLLSQDHIILSALALIGLPYIVKRREMRYILTILVSTIVFLSNTFSLYATRYIYFLQPLLIILASAVLLKFAELAWSAVEDAKGPVAKGLRYGVPALLSFILFMGTNDYILKPYRLSPNPAPVENPRNMALGAVMEERRNMYPVDFRGVNTYLKAHLQPGDAVMTVYTHPTLYYAGKADYFEETIVDTQVVFLDDNEARLANKTVDIPSITDLATFKLTLADHKRVWFVASSYELFNYLNERKFVDYFMGTMKPVYETYRARLYLWENGKRI